jgi:O-acetyl-ADP-ribose deacetylase (regulator of RNase III)
VNTNIFDSTAQTLVNPVNTVGVMGGGLALKFKNHYPEMYKSYKNACDTHNFIIGSLHKYLTGSGKIILCIATKEHWRNPSHLEYIAEGLKAFVSAYKFLDITSVSFPKLGCGLGGLSWNEEVKPLMENHLGNLEIDVFIHI